jgi:hypothetical protein
MSINPLDKDRFRETFIATFLATHEALNYQQNCFTGWKNHSVPVDDADCLAEEAWEALEKA